MTRDSRTQRPDAARILEKIQLSTDEINTTIGFDIAATSAAHDSGQPFCLPP